MKILRTLLFTLALLACVACASDGDSNTEKQDTRAGSPPANTPEPTPNTDTPNNTPAPTPNTPPVVKSPTCQAGNYDTDDDGLRDYTLECHSNGHAAKRINYTSSGKKEEEYTYYESNGNKKTYINYNPDGTKAYEDSFYESNSNRKTRINFFSDGVTKEWENTYYEASNGQLKTQVFYNADGSKKADYPVCYPENSGDSELCSLAKHGCLIENYSCIPNCTYYTNGSPQACIYYHGNGTKSSEYTYYESNGNKKTYIWYRSDGVKKSYEYTYYESNGNRKTWIGYQSDGVTKSQEITYYESNGNLKTWIDYHSDGTKHDGAPYCLTDVRDDGSYTTETCTIAKHGCDSSHYSCIPNCTYYTNGSPQACIYYHGNGTKSSEYTYYESNGNLKTWIVYRSDGVKKSYEYTYYESNGNRKTFINYHSDGVTKYQEITSYESNGNTKTWIEYQSDGTKAGGPGCYTDDFTIETCTIAKHGCDRYHYSCIDLTLYGGGATDCIAGDYDTNSDTKTNFSIACHDNGNRKSYIGYYSDGVKKSSESTYYESNGNQKTRIGYYSDGVKKSSESTYYESNGNLKTWIFYESDGSKSGSTYCYKDDGSTTETCTLEKHGCTSASNTCIQ